VKEGQKRKTLAISPCEFISPANITEQGHRQDNRSWHIFCTSRHAYGSFHCALFWMFKVTVLSTYCCSRIQNNAGA